MPFAVDLRSDTVTQPTDEMRAAMAAAPVGDDLYGEDPTARALEEAYAGLVGKEAAVFCPSGIMANQIAVGTQCRAGRAVVAGAGSHVVAYEDGAVAANFGVLTLGVDDAAGHLDPATVAHHVAGVDHHLPAVDLICAENTHMPSGGRPLPDGHLAELAAIGPPVHLDGARLLNASVATGVSPAELAAPATTVMSCLSKGLGAPIGSVVAGPTDLMAEARALKRRLGGAMRQVGIIAAAGLWALDNHVARLADDHRRARRLADAVADRWPDAIDPTSVATNIVIARLPDATAVVEHLASHGVGAGTVGPDLLRLVTHLDVDDAGLEQACAAIGSAP